jgi:hypothetical protein
MQEICTPDVLPMKDEELDVIKLLRWHLYHELDVVLLSTGLGQR